MLGLFHFFLPEHWSHSTDVFLSTTTTITTIFVDPPGRRRWSKQPDRSVLVTRRKVLSVTFSCCCCEMAVDGGYIFPFDFFFGSCRPTSTFFLLLATSIDALLLGHAPPSFFSHTPHLPITPLDPVSSVTDNRVNVRVVLTRRFATVRTRSCCSRRGPLEESRRCCCARQHALGT
jgi:hypothetical protein